jgi:hypothetical protein
MYEGRPSPEDIVRTCIGAAWVSCCTLAPINGCVTKAFGEPRVTGTPTYGAGAGVRRRRVALSGVVLYSV